MIGAKEKETIVLTAAVRSSRGGQAARQVRREGRIPAVVYRQGQEALPIEVMGKDLSRILRTKARGNVLISLHFGEESKPQLKGHPELARGEGMVLIKELQHHPVSHQVIHVDFHQVSLTQRITVTVPLAFRGEAPGVRQQGGILEHNRWDLEVGCLPTEIPVEVAVDISNLALGQTVHVRDLALPAGVRCITDPNQPVIGCVEPKLGEVPAAAAEGAETAEPEVIKQKKPEEEAGEQPAGKEKEEKPEGKKG